MQLAICFDDHGIPEAFPNDYGVLLGPGLVRQWLPDPKRQDVARIVVRRLAGTYCYGVTVLADSGGSSFAPSPKRNQFVGLEECIRAATLHVWSTINRAVTLTYNDMPKTGAKKLMRAFERNEFTDRVVAE